MSTRRPLLVAAVLLGLAGTTPSAVVAQDALDEARAAALEGRYDDALGAYRGLVRGEVPPAVHREYGRLLAEVGRYQDALEALPTDRPELGVARGEVLLTVGRLDEAEAAFRQAVEGRASDRNTARLQLAVTLWQRGQTGEAMEIFDSFIDLYNGSQRLTSEDLVAVGTAVRYLGLRQHVLFQDALMAFEEAAEAAPGDPRPELVLAELFLEKYTSAEAHPSFNRVLAQNPRHPRALLGRARALDFDGSGEALPTVERALETNPNYPDAHAFRARLMLKTEDFGEARQEAERALEVNPRHLEAISVLAATRYLEGDRVAFARLRDQVRELNPAYPDLYNTVAELAVDHRRYADAVELATEAVQIDSTSWRGYGILGINQLRTGAIEEGRQNIERAFEGDPYNPWFKNNLDLLDTFDEYETVRTEHFELFLHGQEAALMEPYVSELAEEAFSALQARYAIEPPTPIRLEIFPSHADFSVRTLGLTGLGALGVSFGSTLVMDSPSARDPGGFNWASVLWHELAHTFHLALTDHRVPRWFSEGLAVHEQRLAREHWGHRASPQWLQAYRAERLHPVSRLNEGFVRPEYPEQVIFSYFQASLVFDLIESQWGFDAILDMLEGYRSGRSTGELIAEVLGQEPDAFDETFDTYVNDRFGTRMDAVEPLTDDLVPGQLSLEGLAARAARHPASFEARLTYGAALLREDRLDEAETELRAAIELFPDYGGADSPLLLLATVHRERGELAEAAAALHRLGLLNESLYRTHVEESELLLELGQQSAAADALQRAVEVYPYDIGQHRTLAQLLTDLGRHDEAVLERRAVLGLDAVDRAEARYQLARALLNAGDRAEARREVLRALEIAPTYEAALNLLLEIRGGGQ